MLNNLNRAPWLMNNATTGYIAQWETKVKRMYSNSTNYESNIYSPIMNNVIQNTAVISKNGA